MIFTCYSAISAKSYVIHTADKITSEHRSQRAHFLWSSRKQVTGQLAQNISIQRQLSDTRAIYDENVNLFEAQ